MEHVDPPPCRRRGGPGYPHRDGPDGGRSAGRTAGSNQDHLLGFGHAAERRIIVRLPYDIHGWQLDQGCGRGRAREMAERRATRNCGVHISGAQDHPLRRGDGILHSELLLRLRRRSGGGGGRHGDRACQTGSGRGRGRRWQSDQSGPGRGADRRRRGAGAGLRHHRGHAHQGRPRAHGPAQHLSPSDGPGYSKNRRVRHRRGARSQWSMGGARPWRNTVPAAGPRHRGRDPRRHRRLDR